MKLKLKNLENKRFGNLTILGYAGHLPQNNSKKRKHHWKCLCDCGEQVIKKEQYLLSGRVVSCGCRKKRKGSGALHFQGYGEVPLKYFNAIKRRCSKNNVEFSISIEEIWNTFLSQNRKCALSGEFLTFNNIGSGKHTASLDRIDSLKGYTPKNIQWIHKDINFLKQDFEESYFIGWCKKIAKFNK